MNTIEETTVPQIVLSVNSEKENKLRQGAAQLEGVLNGLYTTYKGFGLKRDLSPAALYTIGKGEAETLIREFIVSESSYYQSLPYSHSHVLKLVELPKGFHNFTHYKGVQDTLKWKAQQRFIELPPVAFFEVTESGSVEVTESLFEKYVFDQCYRVANETETEVFNLCLEIQEKFNQITALSPLVKLLPKTPDLLLNRPVFSADPEGKLIFNKGAIRS